MAKVLVTGFDPFAGSSLNPSKLIAQALAETPNVETIVLPVEYDSAARMLATALARHDYSAVISIGQAEGRTALSFERVAVNLDDATLPDNGGEVRVDLPIDLEGPAAYFSTLPVKEMVAAVRAIGLPAELSMSAGAFVCNHVFYRLQQMTAGAMVSSGFVHVPLVHEQADEFPGKPTMSLEDMVLGMRTAISVIG